MEPVDDAPLGESDDDAADAGAFIAVSLLCVGSQYFLKRETYHITIYATNLDLAHLRHLTGGL